MPQAAEEDADDADDPDGADVILTGVGLLPALAPCFPALRL